MHRDDPIVHRDSLSRTIGPRLEPELGQDLVHMAVSYEDLQGKVPAFEKRRERLLETP